MENETDYEYIEIPNTQTEFNYKLSEMITKNGKIFICQI